MKLHLLVAAASVQTSGAFFGRVPTRPSPAVVRAQTSWHYTCRSVMRMSVAPRPVQDVTTQLPLPHISFVSPRPPTDASTAPLVREKKRVYLFAEGGKEDKQLLGGKGANLAEMTNMGLPVPPGFVISTETCLEYFEQGQQLPHGLIGEYEAAIREVEESVGRVFGDASNPLLFSVRSGAAVSMPGMMDTVLNLGINDQVAEALSRQSGNERWALDTYRRFLQMFATVVMGEDGHRFDEVLESYKRSKAYLVDTDMTAEDWRAIIATYKTLVSIPSDPREQLQMAIKAVFSSWFTPRAKRYREFNDIPDSLGTAVTVQAMVFGNMGEDSGTGVMFTRNPSNGDRRIFGEYLVNAAGEDVVAGIRTPADIKCMSQHAPDVYKQVLDVAHTLEAHYHDMQDIEFTVQQGKLYLLQCRSGKRTAKAAVKIAVDMVREGLIDRKSALLRIDASKMDFFLHPTIDPQATKTVVAHGLPASPGVGTGEIVFNSDEAEALSKAGRRVILVRKETTAEDIHGMKAAQGILTEQGGMTSHAAVVARGMGKSCVVGCQEIKVDTRAGSLKLPDGRVVGKGDVVTVDGSTGEVIQGEVATVRATADEDFMEVLAWADQVRTMGVKANADTPQDAKKARELGAEGIGLCRTEHMFFAPERIDVVRRMILAETKEERDVALAQIFEFQREDMREIFKAMSGFPVTIRLLDPPLHEFLPQTHDDIRDYARRVGKSEQKVAEQVAAMEEVNPMLGFRGCRLSITTPEITEMQVRALIHGAVEARNEGYDPRPEVMVPLVGLVSELARAVALIKRTAEETMDELGGQRVQYRLGTMLELPRACVIAGQLAPMVEFMSFGTNDLTQTTYGLSRDDASRFLPAYVEQKVIERDPFATLDTEGVGHLMKMAVDQCRGTGVEFGICGEHGGDPKSISFVQSLGLNYVSCSPYRVPIARIAVAQSAIIQATDNDEHDHKPHTA